MEVAFIIVSVIAFVVFITPILVDYNILKKYADTKFKNIYILIKALVYIVYPLFIVVYLNIIRVENLNPQWGDFSMPAAYNQSTIEFMAVFLLVVGFISLLIGKYMIFSSISVKRPIAKLLIEVLYFPFIVAALLVALW